MGWGDTSKGRVRWWWGGRKGRKQGHFPGLHCFVALRQHEVSGSPTPLVQHEKQEDSDNPLWNVMSGMYGSMRWFGMYDPNVEVEGGEVTSRVT